MNNFLFFFLIKEFRFCHPGWNAVGQYRLPQPPKCWDYNTTSYLVPATTYQHTWLTFVFLVEMGFQHVGQAGLELLTSGDPSTSASQSIGITGVSHSAWLRVRLFKTIGQVTG